MMKFFDCPPAIVCPLPSHVIVPTALFKSEVIDRAVVVCPPLFVRVIWFVTGVVDPKTMVPMLMLAGLTVRFAAVTYIPDAGMFSVVAA